MDPISPKSSPLVRLAQSLGLDSAVFFAVLARSWQLLTGPVTQVLIVVHFLTSTLDYYYAFNSLLGTQIFIELGLSVIVIAISSHEWAKLSLVEGMPVGDSDALARLASLHRRMTRWYSIAAGVFLVAMSAGGMLYFGATQEAATRAVESWTFPWMVMVLVNAVQLVLLPMTAMLEGCHQVATLNRVRFWQGVAGTLAVWVAVSSGAGLWSLVISSSIRLAGEIYLVLFHYRSFFATLNAIQSGPEIHWKEEVLPLQWRIAVQGILLWFASGLPALLVFSKLPEGEAGRLGMTWTILSAAQAAALAWVETRRPQFGALIAERNFSRLDQMFFRQARMSCLLMALAGCFLITLVWIFGHRDEWICQRFSERLLPLTGTCLMAIGFITNQPGLCANIYVRAHKRDPFLVASSISNVSVALLQLVLGLRFGVTGVAAGYCLGISFVQTPLLLTVWWRTRREWH
ncbi:MAG: hypothetical protein U0996_12275 [Planctomycetaceae bacterium]